MYSNKASSITRGRASLGPKAVVAAFILIAMVLIASLPTGAVFSKLTVSSLSWNPTKPQPGDNANVFVTVTNTGSAEVKIKWIGIHFDWQASNTYIFEDRTSSPITIASQGQYIFVLLVPIPTGANFTVHPYSIKINYDSESSQYSETTDTLYDFALEKYVPPVEKPFWESQLFLIMILLIVVAIVLVVVMVVVRQRRIAKEASKKQLEMKSCLTANSDNVDYELARTVTKDRSRPTRVDGRTKQWETPKDQRITGNAPKAPIYKLLGTGQAPQQMPQAPPQAQPMAPPQTQPPQQSSGAPKPMPARPPPMVPVPQPRGPPPLPTKDQATLHQCPICGKMNKASDTTCPKCGGSL